MPAQDLTASKLSGKVALVTGSAKRLGREIALRLAREGADVIVHFHNSRPDAASAVSDIVKLGKRGLAVQADLSRNSEIKRLFADAQNEFGRLDILVNNASNFLHTDFESTTEESWDASINVNLRAAFFCAQAAAPMLKQSHGVIINLSDVGGLLAWTGYIPHCVAKAGVNLLTRALAKKLAPEVRVNAIAPGTISFPDDPPDWAPNYSKLAPLRHTGAPEDVTAAVSFLVNSPFITGQVLVLDGGRTL
ncbi:MAG: SDR family oxidoreductase [Acidobacteriota bacterium]|nr:SDR family oxidoreductase [Acidobacteriota bacterium]